MRYTYVVTPMNHPSVIRNCAKCGAKRAFLPSNQFRINAQKKLLDIWLIYQCQCCGQTWNMELFARVPPKRLDRTLYDRLLSNDALLIDELAFDAQLHAVKGAPLCLDELRYHIEGEAIAPDQILGLAEIIITCPVELGVRVSKLLREILSVSGKQFERMVDCGALSSPEGLNLMKARMGKRLSVRLDPTYSDTSRSTTNPSPTPA